MIPTDNQVLEGCYNRKIKLGKSDVIFSAKGSTKRWINTVKAEEVAFSNLQYQINSLNSKPKEKRKLSKAKDSHYHNCSTV